MKATCPSLCLMLCCFLGLLNACSPQSNTPQSTEQAQVTATQQAAPGSRESPLGFWDPTDSDCSTPELEIREGEVFVVQEQAGQTTLQVVQLSPTHQSPPHAGGAVMLRIAQSILGTPPTVLQSGSQIKWQPSTPKLLTTYDAGYPSGQRLFKPCSAPRYEEQSDSPTSAVLKFVHYNLTGHRTSSAGWEFYRQHIIAADEHHEEPGYDTVVLVDKVRLLPPRCKDDRCVVLAEVKQWPLPFYLRRQQNSMGTNPEPGLTTYMVDYDVIKTDKGWRVTPEVPGLEVSFQTYLAHIKD